MRLAHHLVRHFSGTWHFRLVVPRALRSFLGRSVVKISMRTCDVLQARIHAYELSLRYAAFFEVARRSIMPKAPNVQDILAAHASGQTRQWTLERDPISGTLTKIQTDGSAQDNTAALEALKVIFASPLPPTRGATTTTASSFPVGITPIALGEAARKYIKTLRPPTPAKTITQKTAAVHAFTMWKSVKRYMHEVNRTDVSDWLQTARDSGLTTATLENKAAYVKAFFAWGQSAGHFPVGDNPAEKQIKRAKNEKRQRLKYGFRALTPDDIQTLFAATALEALNEQTRWGAVIGLYTGARVSEIGQLALVDFFEESGVFSMRISDEGIGQSIKNEASRRTIPVHPHLIELGLKERVERFRSTGETQLFPRAKAGSVNGMGNWLSKSFGDHLARHGIQTPVGIVGFHSLRKTVIQALKDCGVREEARKEYVGHELEGEHHVRYGKLFSPAQLLNGVPKGALETAGIRELAYDLNRVALRAALAAGPPKRKRKTAR